MIYKWFYHIYRYRDKKDRYNIITSLNYDPYETILENLSILDQGLEEGANFQRRTPVISDLEFSAYRKKLEDSKFDILRSTTELAKLAVNAANSQDGAARPIYQI